jgi:MerR family transcriptional regulator, light-induced transcriptional regulator
LKRLKVYLKQIDIVEKLVSDPLYRIQAVSKLTGVPPATLRAWERRYGFPEPERTESSYRLYSEAQIVLIKQLKALCQQGLAPSEAVKILKEQMADQRVSANEDVESNEGAPVVRSSKTLDEDQFAQTRQNLMGAVHRFDPILLERHTRAALIQGSAKQVFDHIFAPVLVQIGQEWHDGILSIAQEHLATEVIGNAIRDLLRFVQPDQNTKQIVLACVTGELHLLPLYGSAFHFIHWGYRVTILGVNTPPEALKQSVQRLKPSAVGISITCPKSIEETRGRLPKYIEACHGLPLILGGTGITHFMNELDRNDVILANGSPQEVKALFEARVARGIIAHNG